MENIVLGIVSADQDYCRALGLSLLALSDDFLIHYFDTKNFVRECNRDEGDFMEQFDLILWDGKEIEDTYNGHLIFLAEKASLVKKDYQNQKFSLYKYCGASAMTSALFEIYSCLTGRGVVFIPKDLVSMIAFGSWEGGSGCTTVTLAVAQELCRFHGNRILVLSLESVESTAGHFDYVPEIKSIGEFLYRVLPEKIIDAGSASQEKTVPFFESYIVKDLYGIEAFAPSRGKNPISELSEEDMQKLVATVIDSGRYDAVLIDMGTCLTKAAVAVMEMADKLCFITKNQQVTRREEMYLGHVMVCAGEETLSKAIRLTNMVKDASTDNKEEGSRHYVNERARARAFEFSVAKSEPEQIILEGAFGEDIRKLAQQLLRR